MENDLISRHAAIDLFPDDDLESDTKGAYIAPHLARQMICELPSAQQRWIPCSERLPDKTGRYLVTCSTIGAWETDWNIFYAETKPGWLYENGVIAWMPLPEPYKAERREE